MSKLLSLLTAGIWRLRPAVRSEPRTLKSTRVDRARTPNRRAPDQKSAEYPLIMKSVMPSTTLAIARVRDAAKK